MEGESEAWQVSERVQRVVLGFAYFYGVLFVLGILLLAVFVTVNLTMEGSAMSQEKVQKSIPPATFQKPVTPPPAKPVGTSQPKPQQPPATQMNLPKKG